jgi:hypothetical protein
LDYLAIKLRRSLPSFIARYLKQKPYGVRDVPIEMLAQYEQACCLLSGGFGELSEASKIQLNKALCCVELCRNMYCLWEGYEEALKEFTSSSGAYPSSLIWWS